VKPTEEVSNLINCLTQNEDQRQELWVYYLSGNSPSSFASYLEKIQIEHDIDTRYQRLGPIFKKSSKFYSLLGCFSEIEQTIVCLLAIGLTIPQIAKYKGISEVRIRHIVNIIRYNVIWEELYDVKPKTPRASY